jgi:hypothetical protein
MLTIEAIEREVPQNRVWICADGGELCSACVEAELEVIREAMAEPATDEQWEVVGSQEHSASSAGMCDHCGGELPVEDEGARPIAVEFCEDCYNLEFLDDTTWLDYSQHDSDEKERAHAEGRAELVAPGGVIPAGRRFSNLITCGEVDEASNSDCACCGTSMLGARYRVLIVTL